MPQSPSSPLAGDKLKKAVAAFVELVNKSPDKNRSELLKIIQLRFDLTPLECEFLDKHLSSD